MYALIFYMALNNTEPVTQVFVVDESGFMANELKNTEQLTFISSNDPVAKIKQNITSSKAEHRSVLLVIPKDVATKQEVELYDTEKKGIGTLNHIEEQLNNILKSKALKEAGVDIQVIDNIKPNIHVNSKELTLEGEKESSVGAAVGISFVLSILIYISLFLYGSQVMRGIIEEKSNRIIEVIISSVKPFQLMMGKIVGIGLVGLTQFILWIILSLGFMVTATTLLTPKAGHVQQTTAFPNQEQVQEVEETAPKTADIIKHIKTLDYKSIITFFLVYFIGGYLTYSALFAIVGSAVDSETETQQFMLPIIMPLLFTYMLSFSVLINNPHGSLAFWLSMIPFTSPIGMLVRIPFGVPAWQLILSITLLILGFLCTTYIAARVYRVGILMYGKKASYKEIIKWFNYKG